jgi:hypothetical protein
MLRRRFPSVPFEFSTEGTLIAALPAPYPELGDLEIHEDGIEAIAEVGDVTHGHFYPYDKKDPGAAAEVAESLGDFLADLFEDKICMFTSSLGGGHGKVTDKWPRRKSNRKTSKKYYLWSGPAPWTG